MRTTKINGGAAFFVMRASNDERKRGQSDEMVVAYHRANYPGYAYWFEAQRRDSEWEADCKKRLLDFKAEVGDEMTPLQKKEQTALQQDLSAAEARKHFALEEMRKA